MKHETAEPAVHTWMSALTPADRESCQQDIAASAGTERLEDELRVWRETVTAVSADHVRDDGHCGGEDLPSWTSSLKSAGTDRTGSG